MWEAHLAWRINNQALPIFKGETKLFQIPNLELKRQAPQAQDIIFQMKFLTFKMIWDRHQAGRLKQQVDQEHKRATPRTA